MKGQRRRRRSGEIVDPIQVSSGIVARPIDASSTSTFVASAELFCQVQGCKDTCVAFFHSWSRSIRGIYNTVGAPDVISKLVNIEYLIV